MPRVFISYRHESAGHRREVRAMATRLREHLDGTGVEVLLDQFLLEAKAEGPSEGWPAWSAAQVKGADRVIIVASPGWRACFDGAEEPGSGAGAACEAGLVRLELYKSHGRSDKFRVCLLDPAHVSAVPDELQHFHTFSSPGDDDAVCAWILRRAVSPVAGRPGALGPRPTLLPYLMNRAAQELALTRAWETHSRGHPHRPLLCVLHGGEDQCNHQFLQRLQEDLLPRLPGLFRPGTALHPVSAEWPRRSRDPEAFRQQLCWNISRQFLGHAPTRGPELLRHLVRHPGPLMISTQMLSSQWGRQGREYLEAFLRFWEACPDLESCPGLLVVLNVTYTSPRGWRQRWWPNPARHLRRSLEKDLPRRSSDLLTIAVLDELRDLERDEVETWVPNWAAAASADINAILDRIRELCADTQSFPMERVVRELRPLLGR